MSNSISEDKERSSYLGKLEDDMEKSSVKVPPRWMFLLLSIGGAWASGVYLGKISLEGSSAGLLVPMIGFGVMGLIMALGALSKR